MKKFPVIVLILLFLWPAAGCGKKASPVAPESTVPERVSDLRAEVRGGTVSLRWSVPNRNIDDSKLTDLVGFKVFRREQTVGPEACRECSQRFAPVAEIDVDYPRGAQVVEERVLWRDPSLQRKREYVYFVVAYNGDQYPSPESNRVKVNWDDPPAAPTRVNVVSEDLALEISWEFAPRLVTGEEMKDLAGFNLYRRSEGESFGAGPLNAQPVPEKPYRDAVLENGKRYEYEVRSVRLFQGTLIEGPSSPVADGIPQKRSAPLVPTGLAAAWKQGKVALRWDKNPEKEVAGYDLYRREKGEEDWRQINPRVITETEYLDGGADPQKTHGYALKAVDSSPAQNVSPFSQEVEVAPENSPPKKEPDR